MIKVKFSEKDIEEIKRDMKSHPHHKVRQKMEALWMKHIGIPHFKICQILCICGNTLRSYLREYAEGGLDAIREIRFYRPKSKLANYKNSLKAYFKKHPYRSASEAAAVIEKMTGIRLSPKRVREFLKSLGFKRLKVGHIPAKADVEKQREFIDEQLMPRIDEAKEEKRAVFFVDAAHFVMAPFLGFVWCLARVFIKSPAGRKRFNVLGALDAISGKIITVTNDSYINADSVAELIQKIADLNLKVPVTLVMDNARYQKCRFIKELADFYNIELLYLPPYSPNLNLIERLWKFVKSEALNNKYFEDFDAFKSAISGCLMQTQTKYKEKLRTLLNPKFQTFNDVDILAQ